MPKHLPLEDLAELRRLCASGDARRTRVDSQLTLTEFAEEIEVTATSISRWELGVRRPRGEEAERYYRILQRLERLNAAAS